MIVRRDVFDDDHLPRTLSHRDAQIHAFLDRVQLGARDDRDGDLLVSGPSGVGKTALARYSLTRYERSAGIPFAHVKTMGKSDGDILRSAIRQHPGADPVFANTPTDELPRRLEQAVIDQFVIILDEADDLAERDVLHDLLEIDGVTIVPICHDPDTWLSRAAADVRGRFHTHMALDRYSVDELADILDERARIGLPDGVITRSQLEEIADTVAGVARNGIQSLRASAEVAHEEGAETIQDRHIEQGYERARQRIREANLDSLTTHHHVLYEIVRRDGALTGTRLHAAYDELGDEAYRGHPQTPIGRRARRLKLSKLVDYDLIEREDVPGGVEYQVVDPDVRSDLELKGLPRFRPRN